jgi:hypothetical protein
LKRNRARRSGRSPRSCTIPQNYRAARERGSDESACRPAHTHTWSGTARREGAAWLLHFTHTTSTRPARDCDESFRCEPDADVRGALRCTPTRTFGHHGNDRLIPTYFRVPLLLARGRALPVAAYGSDSGHASVTVREQ